jgi:uncharacterized protein (DUF2249 family)
MSSDEQTVLDVRNVERPNRHALVFKTYDALQPGEGFVLVNDHDPKPLRFQFDTKHAGAYSWDYLEEGPALWRVLISRATK